MRAISSLHSKNSFHNRRCSHEHETASGRMSRFRHLAPGAGKRSQQKLQMSFNLLFPRQHANRLLPCALRTSTLPHRALCRRAPAVRLSRARSGRPARDLAGRGTDERPSAEMHDDGSYELQNQTFAVPGRAVASLTHSPLPPETPASLMKAMLSTLYTRSTAS